MVYGLTPQRHRVHRELTKTNDIICIIAEKV